MFSKTTPRQLAALIEANIGTEVGWPDVPIDGARNAARILKDFLAASAGRD
jgi:hypothetical protein